jgi:OOP family OmpA-OmpF porin
MYEECGDITDRDKDGITDKEDKCPDNTKEEIANGVYQDGERKGCPVDGDGDGVPDYRDECPNTPACAIGHVDKKGCALDTDNDGVKDGCDKCETPANKTDKVNSEGCAPNDVIIEDVFTIGQEHVNFAFDKAVVRASGKKLIANLANESILPNIDKLAYVKVVGYADSIGAASYNKRLSKKRAEAVAKVLIQAGIPEAKLEIIGAGETDKFGSNKTRKGRAQNRRVEIRTPQQ